MPRVETDVTGRVRGDGGHPVCRAPLGLETKYEGFEFFAVADAPELALQVPGGSLRIPVIVAFVFFFLFDLDDVGHAGAMEDLEVLKSGSESRGGGAEAQVGKAEAAAALPGGAAQVIVGED